MNASPSLCLAAVAVLAAAAAVPAARADVAGQDWKGYAGLNCLSQNDSGSVRRSSVSQPALANMGTSTMTVYCPVVRDEASGGPNRVSAVAVRIRNRHATLPARCEFSSHDQDGNKVGSKSAVAPFGETTLQLGPMNAHNWGTYVLTCQLPGTDPATGLASYIVNYRVDESLP